MKGIINLILDRVEGNWAVFEYQGQMLKLPVAFLPKDAREGDELTLHMKINREATATRKQRIDSLAAKLFRDK